MQTALDPSQYYRLPWTLNDNILGWLEPTKRCNLECEGCYSRNDPDSDKSLEQIRDDLRVFVKNRKMDSISIAGGDPLVYPQIVEVVAMIRDEFGLKPVLNTNGLALDQTLLRELRQAGVYGFTFHIDSSQGRPGWKDASEVDLNELRHDYAKMVADEGGMSVAFNSTVFPHTIDQVPALVAWAGRHIDIVHNMVFILFRTMRSRDYDYFVNGRKLDDNELVYWDQKENSKPLTADTLVAKIREGEPEYEPCAYLGGTVDPQSLKWLMAGRIGDGEQVFGYVGGKYMELVQSAHHAATGRYLAYTRPEILSHGRSMLLGFSALDKGVRRAAARYVKHIARHPTQMARKLHFQSLLIIQPVDAMADGSMNMCDGCPDMTVHDGKLVWSCRLDEQLQYGCFLTAVPKAEPLVQVRSRPRTRKRRAKSATT